MPFSRRSTTMIVSELQRFFADGAPVVVHAIVHGHFAMDLFFLMSSFLLTSAVVGEARRNGGAQGMSVGGFVARRLMRLVPVYYSLLAVLLLQPTPIPWAQHAWCNFAFVNNHVPFSQQFFNHTWSLAVEVQFSVLWPVVLVAVLRRRALAARLPTLLAVALVLSVLARAIAVLCLELLYGVALPWPIQTLDWNNSVQAFSPALERFYLWVYLPLWARVTPHMLGALLAFALTPRATFAAVTATPTPTATATPVPNTTNQPAMVVSLPQPSSLGTLGCVALMVVCMVPAMTSGHGVESVLSHTNQVVYLAFARLGYAAPAMLLIYWAIRTYEAVLSERATAGAHHSAKATLPRLLSSLLAWDLWVPISNISYSGYLSHVPLLGGVMLGLRGDDATVAARHLSTLGILSLLLQLIPLVLLVAFVVHVVLERPLLAAREWYFPTVAGAGARPTAAPPPTTTKKVE